MELREPRDQLRNLLQQFVEIEDRRDFTSKLEQRDDKLTNIRGRRRGSNCGSAKSGGRTEGPASAGPSVVKV